MFIIYWYECALHICRRVRRYVSEGRRRNLYILNAKLIPVMKYLFNTGRRCLSVLFCFTQDIGKYVLCCFLNNRRKYFSWSPFFRKSTTFWKFGKLRPLLRAKRRWRWIWKAGGLIMTGDNRSTRMKTCPNATSSTTNRTWTGLGLNLALCGERKAVNLLRHVTAVYLTLNYVGLKYSVHNSQTTKLVSAREAT
jgi:hypothetical protein